MWMKKNINLRKFLNIGSSINVHVGASYAISLVHFADIIHWAINTQFDGSET